MEPDEESSRGGILERYVCFSTEPVVTAHQRRLDTLLWEYLPKATPE